ncbi:MAG: hypothetical protein UX80_C0023G0006 [Candidatus Amesbacteria bacterium GW2011_GWA2_47_11b]|uniref:Inositol-phosphate phosphatase n=3 Tax=Candidatus Amesiibacteriota TaxID=1752730 RepID=A0A0G1SB33_9BACT|nr:MAG: hypothetical protein UX42_C0030G0006 [Microgenomates group bacterium GW2011_GWC1_46_20]KKU57198.1 MAG: hypothetical protein UX80_C0023G0006 [Candidatus Amesbacteria bacterium GW2011_GWA2_47_11b]KKU66719.1 MAG: hypothetical protein UX92_C0035G0005 [Candidatus Amesbacteria bacterium GW2011_GWA1_47_20]KKU83230.1 MAG: hypothetical protein UY11_C0025G0005 [Candidatus Amesbacteria bacterium GW2011_GWC2_47_8]
MKTDYLEVAINAVKKAGEIIEHYRLSGKDMILKADGSPVTIADNEAEEIIISDIKQSFPDHRFLGEETGGSVKEGMFPLWIIDPIDGTKNYLRGIPLYATQIALMKEEGLVLGVSYAPFLGELMYAERGHGAFLNGKKVAVSTVGQMAEAYMSYGGISHFDHIGRIPSLLGLERATRGHRGWGDFWAYHLLAQGKVDIVVEARIKIWDVAAAKVIVEEAGGKMTDLTGKEVGLETTSILATNKLLHEQVMSIFSVS